MSIQATIPVFTTLDANVAIGACFEGLAQGSIDNSQDGIHQPAKLNIEDKAVDRHST
ncbi:hypothetical protein [Pseudomonas sp. CGJS7]|uniref:hypothetical protein n=1 Tax=Pseudomonas sp. CGJS7 TaxID=3109348 RepID=UPI00300B4185